MRYSYTFETTIGKLRITEDDSAITGLELPSALKETDEEHDETPLLLEAARQLGDYFSGKLTVFSLPLAPAGTPFMKQVWDQLLKVPYGQTCSYKDIAVAIHRPLAVRAVGMANHRNPIAIIIPCHRIIGANGSLIGYGGGLPLKQTLLDHEKRILHA